MSVTETSTRPSFWPARTSIRHAPWLADYIAINGPMWDLSPEDLKDLIKEHSWLRISEAEAQVYCNPPALPGACGKLQLSIGAAGIEIGAGLVGLSTTFINSANIVNALAIGGAAGSSGRRRSSSLAWASSPSGSPSASGAPNRFMRGRRSSRFRLISWVPSSSITRAWPWRGHERR